MSAPDYIAETLDLIRAALAPQPTTEAGRLYRDYLEGVEMGVFGDWRTGAPRPGQWGERAHRRRAKRREKAAERRAITRARRKVGQHRAIAERVTVEHSGARLQVTIVVRRRAWGPESLAINYGSWRAR